LAESAAFESLCDFLETETSLDRLESRGTLRIALKKAGLNARDADSKQLVVVVEKLLVDELDARGVAGAEAVCQQAARRLQSLNEDARANSPQSVFERMAGE
jgi:hypothetical protein